MMIDTHRGDPLYSRGHNWSSYRAAANDYRARLNWSVYALGTVVWMAPGYVADALSLPSAVGASALDELHAMDTSAPVIKVPGPPDRWMFLAKAGTGPADDIAELFAGRDIGHAHGGYYHGRTSVWGIDLPPTQHPNHDPLSWVVSAETPLPQLTVLVDAVLTALRRSGPAQLPSTE